MRALAGRTSTAAREIKQLIAESAEQVARGSSRSQEASDRMHAALEAVGKVSAVLEHISASAAEQRTGVSQINEAVTHMDGITQQNAAMVEELAATAHSLQVQVESVNDSMRLFRLVPGEATVAEDNAVALRREAKAPAAVLPARPAAARAAPSAARQAAVV